MIMTCVNNRGVEEYLDVGKNYEVTQATAGTVYALDNNCDERWFVAKRFESLDGGGESQYCGGLNDKRRQGTESENS